MNLNKPVKIHNSLAAAKYSLNISEQKLFIYAIRHLNQNNENFIESRFRLTDFAKFAHLEITRLYKEIDSMSDNLMKTIIKIKNSEDKWVKYNLTRNCQYDDGVIFFIFNDDMKKLLLQLQEHYFLQPPDIMQFKSKHSIRIYDLLKSKSYSQNIVEIDIEELKEILELEEKYDRITDFKNKVIDVAMTEINEFSDIKIEYKNVYYGRKIGALEFCVERDVKEKSLFGELNDVNLYREKIGLGKEYTASQIEKLYTTAVNKYTTYRDMEDIFTYMRICYEYTLKMKAVDEFFYYKDVLEKDYAGAIAQINTGYFLDSLKSTKA